jgi:hypothetical protein
MSIDLGNNLKAHSTPKLKEDNLKNLRELLNGEEDWAVPENKYLNLTLSYFATKKERIDILDKLTRLDPHRQGFYEDQKRKLVSNE